MCVSPILFSLCVCVPLLHFSFAHCTVRRHHRGYSGCNFRLRIDTHRFSGKQITLHLSASLLHFIWVGVMMLIEFHQHLHSLHTNRGSIVDNDKSAHVDPSLSCTGDTSIPPFFLFYSPALVSKPSFRERPGKSNVLKLLAARVLMTQ